MAVEITQTTGNGSWCSPAQNGNNDNVTCNGVDPRAEHYLNDLLDRMNLDLKQKTAEANDWAHRYNELNAQLEETKKRLSAKGEDATLVQTAQDLLHEGKLEEARSIFDRLIRSDEANVDRAAQDHFGRASVLALQFRWDEALSDYDKAYQYRPEDPRFAEGYAPALLYQRDFPKAELVLQQLLKQLRSSAMQDPAANRPDLAWTLDNLGVLYGNTRRFADAEAAYKEAAAILRELAAQDPATYRHDLAGTLNNLGNVYDNTHHSPDAEAAYNEAADIDRKLAAQSPVVYRPDLAVTLTNLGVFYGNARRFADAEAAYTEVVPIWRELAAQKPAAYRPSLASTLDSLAGLYWNTNRFTDAETAVKEGIAIQRELSAQNPAHRPQLALMLNHLSFLSRMMHRFDEAETADKEAANIYRELALQNPAAYRPDLAQTLNNLASLYRDMHRDSDAKAVEAEALAAATGTNSPAQNGNDNHVIINGKP